MKIKNNYVEFSVNEFLQIASTILDKIRPNLAEICTDPNYFIRFMDKNEQTICELGYVGEFVNIK